MINILILSVGTRNKVVEYFKNTLTIENGERIGHVIATDMSNLAPAIYEADKFYLVPKMTERGYIEVIFDICRKEKITAAAFPRFIFSFRIQQERRMISAGQSSFITNAVCALRCAVPRSKK